ncbi:MAG: GNAT family N-acetyltransferase [Bacteroidota bacterium]
MQNVLKGESIYLRAPEMEDLETLYAWENNPVIWELSNTLAPFSKQVLRQYLQSAHQDLFTNKQVRFMICNLQNEAIGSIDLFEFEPFHLRVGVGILIASEQNRKKGYASEALDVIKKYCFSVLHLNQLYCNINRDNEASILLFQKQGFVVSGTKLKWNKTATGYKDEFFLQCFNPKA